MKFNQVQESVEERTETTNYEGGEAFEPDSPEVALYKNVINNLLEDSFYESDEESFAAVEEAFDKCADTNPEFVLKLAKYSRQEENLRQVPQALLVLSANDERTQEYVRDYATDIMSRADEPLDVLALHVSRNGKTLPNCLEKSIEDALHTYNQWQYSKWNQSSREWQYRDLLNLVHPNPRDEEREEIFEKIVLGDLDDYDVEPLKQEDTWESSLSEDDGRDKAEKYREQLDEGNMGLFPRIRQARDMLQAGLGADEIYGDVDDDWVRDAPLYPFRYYQSYKAVRNASDIPQVEKKAACSWLEHAVKISTENLPDVLEDTFVAVDISGSMNSPVSNNSDLHCDEIGALFGALLYERGADVAAFARDVERFHGDPRDSVVTNVKKIRGMRVGGATNGYLVPEMLRENDMDEYSQVVVFTDFQMWSTEDTFGLGNGSTFREGWRSYKQETNPDASLYLVDLQSYGTLQLPEGEPDVYNISGWSSNVVDFIDKTENIRDMIGEIESIEPSK